MKYYIYTLSHPITLEIRYIGKTNNLVKRLWEHVNFKKKSHKTSWIKSLLNEGLKPIISSIEEFEDENKAYLAEIKWITYYKSLGANLINGTEGGEGFKTKDVINENNSHAKINNKQAIEITDLLKNSELSIQEIADKYNCSISVINGIKYGNSWSNLTGIKKRDIKRTRGNSIKNRAKSLKDKGIYQKQSKKIIITPLDKEPLIFDNIGLASKYLKISRSSIIKYANLNTIYKTYKIQYYEQTT